MNIIECRLCGGASKRIFSQTILQRYEVGYYRCDSCWSLQTEEPYWLDEAYETNLSGLDTGAAQRTLTNMAISFFLSKIYNARNVIDFGGGDGLLCRLLRDNGLNCFVKDKYAVPTYAQGFTEPDFQHPDLLLAFEVLEHFPNPKSDLDRLFSLNPRLFFASTGIYANEQADWWYLAPESGQHVFLYSRKALGLIADKYGYRLLTHGDLVLFIRPNSRSIAKTVLTKLILRRTAVRLLRSWIALLPAAHAWKDHLVQREKCRAPRP